MSIGAGSVPYTFKPARTAAEDELILSIGEALDLFLPFRLQRRGRDRERRDGIGPTAEGVRRRQWPEWFCPGPSRRRAGRALGERQVQHALTLIREKRHPGFLSRPLAGLDFLFIFSEQGFAFHRAAGVPGARGRLAGRYGGKESGPYGSLPGTARVVCLGARPSLSKSRRNRSGKWFIARSIRRVSPARSGTMSITGDSLFRAASKRRPCRTSR